MGLVAVLKTITGHPFAKRNKVKAVSNFLRWQLATRLSPYPVVYPFTEKARLIIQKGMLGATGNLYCGLDEFSDMSFLLHLLRPGDVFADIGSNVGSYTILAAAHVRATVYAFEPVPATYCHLLNNILINKIESAVQTFNVALGATKGTLNFTTGLDTINHVAAPNETNTIAVPVERLDDLLSPQAPPVLMKIDVEGFETEVLKGAAEVLARPTLQAIIIELNGSGNRYGYDERKIHEQLLSLGFKATLYNPETRSITPVHEFGKHNTIYIRDIAFVQQRVKEAPAFTIWGYQI